MLEYVAVIFTFIFEGLEKRFAREIAAIKEQYPFEPFKNKRPFVQLTFQEGVDLLKENGVIIDPFEDLTQKPRKSLENWSEINMILISTFFTDILKVLGHSIL